MRDYEFDVIMRLTDMKDDVHVRIVVRADRASAALEIAKAMHATYGFRIVEKF
jgi:hypothetical protein